jgi:SAM-dependent methyltransferase
VATTPRTYDVALRHLASDQDLVTVCADRLSHGDLRIRLERLAVESLDAEGQHESYGASSRSDVTFLSGGALPTWSAYVDRLIGSGGPQDALLVLGPGATAAHIALLTRLPHRSVRDMRDSWDDPLAWRALSQDLHHFGARRESAIEPRFSLAPANLKANTIRSYDDIAELFAEQWFDHPPLRELETFLQLLPRRSSVLDAGCGPGHHARVLSRAGHDVVGIDLSRGMLRQARQRVARVRFEMMDASTDELDAQSFDAIWSAAMALHVPREQLLPLLLNFKRILKPGGLLGLNLQLGRASELVQLKNDHRFFEYYARASDVTTLLNAAGFAVLLHEYGETSRNTHGLDMTLKWGTFYARPRSVGNVLEPRLRIEDRPA